MSGSRRRKFVGPIVSRVTWHGGRGTPYLRRWALLIALERPGHVADQVPHAAGVPPLVVVPGQHLDEIAVDDGGRSQVDDGRVWVAVEVHRHQLLVGGVEDALEGSGGRGAEGIVD